MGKDKKYTLTAMIWDSTEHRYVKTMVIHSVADATKRYEDALAEKDQDFQRTAQMWSALLGAKVTARQVAHCMIALKLSRDTHQQKRDNLVDIAGYARCATFCRS